MENSAAAWSPRSEERATTNSFNAKLDNMRNNPLGIWKFDDALSYWAPAMEEAEFCHRRRPGDVAGETQRVILATPDGFYPSTSPQEGTLILRDWNNKWCFWTLDHSGERFVVKSIGDRSEDGVYWVRWLGVKERYDRQPIAWPIRTPAETSLAARRPSGNSSSGDEFFSVLGDPSDHDASIHDAANADQREPDIASPRRNRRLFSRNALARMAGVDVAEEAQARRRQLAIAAISPLTPRFPHFEEVAAHSSPSFMTPSRNATPRNAGYHTTAAAESSRAPFTSNDPAPGASTQTARGRDGLHIDEEDVHAAGLEGKYLARYKQRKEDYCRRLGDVLRRRQAK